RRRVVVSGIQPTGEPHLGNYLGALSSWVRLQDACAADAATAAPPLFFLADLHAITSPRSAAALHDGVRSAAASLLAVGIDPGRSVLFRQSHVPEHTQLAWLLMCLTPFGDLVRMTQWKSKLAGGGGGDADGRGADSAETAASLAAASASLASAPQQLRAGLLTYPVLQAADILIYRATHVPVGADQRQHLELTSEIARLFNRHVRTLGLAAASTAAATSRSFFPVPRAIGLGAGTDPWAPLEAAHGADAATAARVMSLRRPTAKMSKSDPPAHTLFLTDSADAVRRKIARAVTDGRPGVAYDPPARPGVSNLVGLLAAVTADPGGPAGVAARMADRSHAELKATLTEAVNAALDPVRRRRARWDADPAAIEQVLHAGEAQARAIAAATLRDAYAAMGLT
ncbi:hypothetical protein CXG81DRAFT_3376, partial [Caulochytrium protostelioides]